MTMIGAIDFEQVEDRKDFGLIPPQDVVMAITNSEYKPNSKNTGHALNLEFQILDGEFTGRKLWAMLNLDNPSADAVRIAQAELKQILTATEMLGKFGQDVTVLHNIPMIGTLEVDPERTVNGQTYKAKNKIKKYSPIAAGTSAPVTAKPHVAAQAPNATVANPASTTTPKAGLPPFLANKKQG